MGVIREHFLTKAEFKLKKGKTEKKCREYLPGITNVSKGPELTMYCKFKGLISKTICGSKNQCPRRKMEKAKQERQVGLMSEKTAKKFFEV